METSHVLLINIFLLSSDQNLIVIWFQLCMHIRRKNQQFTLLNYFLNGKINSVNVESPKVLSKINNVQKR
jgi:hypothetical protein